MKTKLFEEVQRGLFVILAVAVVFSVAVSTFALIDTSKSGQDILPALIPIAVAVVILGGTLAIFSKMTITLDEEMLRFGFAPFVIKAPVNEITRIAQSKAGFGRTFGIGIRIMLDGRILYNTFWGNIIEVDFAGKRYAFSCKNPEKFMDAMKTLRPDLV